MKFSIKDSSSKCDQIRRKLRIWLHLLENPYWKTSIFCAVICKYLRNTNLKKKKEKKKKHPFYSRKESFHKILHNSRTDVNEQLLYCVENRKCIILCKSNCGRIHNRQLEKTPTKFYWEIIGR